MEIALVGADLEENLGIGMIAAAAEAAGHRVRVIPFNGPDEMDEVAAAIRRADPDVVGLSVQFQHRAHEFLSLAGALRRRGFAGHITAGGQYPTLAWREVVGRDHGIDTIVLHEGERAFTDLLAVLHRGGRPAEVPGLALRGDDGAPIRTEPRSLTGDLDVLPLAARYRPHSRHVGVPFIPIMGSRGCWGSCAYCSITSFYRDARRFGGKSAPLRLRSPEDVADEMALLWHRAGEPAIFCFHDDNFLLRRPEDSRVRLEAIRRRLDELGAGKVGLVGKCRPETLTPELARDLARLGVIRLYLGVENVSPAGAAHLRRRKQVRFVRRALDACRRAGIFVCYNLLIFEPWATVRDVRENIAFIRERPDHPVNFCRAEPYFGTPLHLKLAERGELGGSYLGWNYRIEDERAELLFRVCSAAFRERNFAPGGVANRSMGIGYALKVAEHFYEPGRDFRFARLRERAGELTRGLTRETAGFLERAADLAESVDLQADADRIARETVLLGLEIARADQRWQSEMDALYDDIDAWAAAATRPPPRPRRTQQLIRLAQGVALGLSITVGAASCGSRHETIDPAPPDASADADDADVMVSDPLPPDSGADADEEVTVVDPLPPDAGRDADEDMVADPLPPDAGTDADEDMVADPLPPDAGTDADVPVELAPPDAGVDADLPVDPPPPDAGLPADPLPRDQPQAAVTPATPDRGAPIGHWRETSVRRAVRSRDLPLYDPPEARLRSERDGERLRVRFEGGPDPISLRWEAKGLIEGEGREVLWTPAPDDQLVAAARSRGGVAVVSLRIEGRAKGRGAGRQPV